MYAYVSSTDSLNLHPQNTPSNFIVQLPQYIRLDKGEWTCGVVQCILPKRISKPVYITTDFVESSVFHGTLKPVLCMTTVKTKEFIHVKHVPVKRNQISTLRIKLVNRRGEEVNFTEDETLLVLEFRQK